MIQEIIIRIIADGAIVPVILIGVYALIFKLDSRETPPDTGSTSGDRFQAYARVLMAGLTAYLLAKLIGSVFQPTGGRPFELLGTAAGAFFLNNPGFPSDHTLLVAAITCAVWFETKQRVLTIVLAGLTVTICIGRVLALVHTPADVVGGVIIALIGALWYLNNKHTDMEV